MTKNTEKNKKRWKKIINQISKWSTLNGMEWKDILHHNELVSINFHRLLCCSLQACRSQEEMKFFCCMRNSNRIINFPFLFTSSLLSFTYRSTFSKKTSSFSINFINFFNNFLWFYFYDYCLKEGRRRRRCIFFDKL